MSMEAAEALLKSLDSTFMLPSVLYALGLETKEQLIDDALFLRAFYLIEQPELIQIFLLTDNSLTIYETNTTEDTLTITVPLERLVRLIEQKSSENHNLIIELDIEKRVTEGRSEWLEGDAENDQKQGRSLSRQESFFTRYTLTAGTDKTQQNLRSFALQLRATINV